MTTQAPDVEIVEVNIARENKDAARCPYCSMLYPAVNEEQKPLRYPEECGRCGCPMDRELARVFANEEAVRAHNPSLAAVGRKMRGEAPVASVGGNPDDRED